MGPKSPGSYGSFRVQCVFRLILFWSDGRFKRSTTPKRDRYVREFENLTH